jgi:hypothetical protein
MPLIAEKGGDQNIAANVVRGGQYQFYCGAALTLLAAALSFLLPSLDQDVIANEDLDFRRYLESHGYDTSVLGVKSADGIAREDIIVDEQVPNKHTSEKTLVRDGTLSGNTI